VENIPERKPGLGGKHPGKETWVGWKTSRKGNLGWVENIPERKTGLGGRHPGKETWVRWKANGNRRLETD